MDKTKYNEYRDVWMVINKKTFDVFIKLYEHGPVLVEKMKRHDKIVNQLIDAGVVRKCYENGHLYYRTSVVGERLFEAVADVCDGVGMGSSIRYGIEDD